MTEPSPSDADRRQNVKLPKGILPLLIAAVLIVDVVILAVFLTGGHKEPPHPAAPISTGWLATGKGITRGVGGLSVFQVHPKTVRFLAAFDSKNSGEPRLAFIDLEEGKPPVPQDLKWPGDRWPVDLEAIAKIPDQNEVFIAATSAGQLWKLRVTEEGSVSVLGIAELPQADAPELEGLDIRKLDGKLVVVWAGRGDGLRAAAVCAGIYDEVTGQATLTNRVEFRAPWPGGETGRHISDLRMDPFGAIIVTSTKDPGNDGPFDSALYVAGKVELQNGTPVLKVNDTPVRLRTDYGHKVEALEFVPGDINGLILGSDDEHGGGAILPTWRKQL